MSEKGFICERTGKPFGTDCMHGDYCNCTECVKAIHWHYRNACELMHKQSSEFETSRRNLAIAHIALKFYADGNHAQIDMDYWDTVSGEPSNYLCDEAGTATVEDGAVAKAAIEGCVLPDDEDEYALIQDERRKHQAERDKFEAELKTARHALEMHEKNIEAMLEDFPPDCVVRVCPGGGPENHEATIAVSVSKLLKRMEDHS